jgi:hypothetical protein
VAPDSNIGRALQPRQVFVLMFYGIPANLENKEATPFFYYFFLFLLLLLVFLFSSFSSSSSIPLFRN